MKKISSVMGGWGGGGGVGGEASTERGHTILSA